MIEITEYNQGNIGKKMDTFAGYKTAGVLGSILATLSMIIGPMIIIIVIANFLEKFKENKYVQAVFYGIRPAVAGLILAACYSIMAISIFNPSLFGSTGAIMDFFNLKALAFFALLLFGVLKFKKHPVVYIAIAAIVGMFIPF